MAERSMFTRNVVADDANWKNRIRTEADAKKNWNSQWGFFAAGGDSSDSLDAFVKDNNTITNLGNSMLAVNLRDSLREAKMKQVNDSVDEFVNMQLHKAGVSRLLPKEEFKRPNVSSHCYGWRKNLEVFGPLTVVLK